MKKICALILAIVMVMAVGSTAFAREDSFNEPVSFISHWNVGSTTKFFAPTSGGKIAVWVSARLYNSSSGGTALTGTNATLRITLIDNSGNTAAMATIGPQNSWSSNNGKTFTGLSTSKRYRVQLGNVQEQYYIRGYVYVDNQYA